MQAEIRSKRDSSLEQPLLQGILFIVLVFLPLAFGSVHAWASLSAAGLIFLALAFAPQIVTRVRQLPLFWVLTSGLTFAWLFFQSFLLAQNRYAALQEGVQWLAAAVLVLWVQGFSARLIFRCLLLIAAVGVLESMYGFFEFFSGRQKVLLFDQGPHAGFVTGTYFNRNHLAGLLELSLGVQLGWLFLAFREERLKRVLGLTLCLGLCLLALLKTGSRGGMISFAIALFAGALTLSGRAGRRAPWEFLIYLLAFGSLLLYASWHMLTPRFLQFVEQAQTWDGRLIAWRNTLEMIGTYFWQGIGLGNYEWIFPQFQSYRLFLGWDHAHQDYLELAAELGVPAVTVWIAGFIGLWVYCVRQFSKVQTDLFPLLWGCLVGVTAFAFHGVTDFNFAVPANVFYFFLLWGFCLRLIRLSAQSQKMKEAKNKK